MNTKNIELMANVKATDIETKAWLEWKNDKLGNYTSEEAVTKMLATYKMVNSLLLEKANEVSNEKAEYWKAIYEKKVKAFAEVEKMWKMPTKKAYDLFHEKVESVEFDLLTKKIDQQTEENIVSVYKLVLFRLFVVDRNFEQSIKNSYDMLRMIFGKFGK